MVVMVDLSNELLALTDASPRIVIGSDNREKIIVPGIGSRFWVYDAHEPWDGYRMLNQGEFLKTTSVDSGLELETVGGGVGGLFVVGWGGEVGDEVHVIMLTFCIVGCSKS